MPLSTDFMLKEFHTEKNSYLYCGKTNQIFCVDPVLVEIIPLYGRFSLDDIQHRLGEAFAADEIVENYYVVDHLVYEHGFFRTGGLRKRISPATEDHIRSELEQDIQQMSLEVTQDCNLHCHYCAHSGGYADRRGHGTRSMSRSVAQAAIDFFFRENRNREQHFSLGFYGGEPLLQFPLLKFCIEYARSLPWQCPEALSFSMTTNATLLDDEAVRFLVDHEVNVSITLDGPVEDHDAHRMDRNGRGSFTKVMAGLRRFNEIAPGYQNLSISCVLAPSSDLLRINDFFVQRRDLFRQIMTSSVTNGHQTLFQEYLGDLDQQGQQQAILYRRYVEAHLQPGESVPDRPDMTFVRQLFERDFLSLQRRPIAAQPASEIEVPGTCLPGKRKIFVDVEGKLHTCERIRNSCSIGDVWNGFDVPAVKRLHDEYVALMNREECLNCWAVHFCPACFANMAEDGRLSLERTQSLCQDTRDSLARTLRAYCTILERDPQAFDYMNESRFKLLTCSPDPDQEVFCTDNSTGTLPEYGDEVTDLKSRVTVS